MEGPPTKKRKQTTDFVPSLPTPKTSEGSKSPSNDDHVQTANSIVGLDAPYPPELYHNQFFEYFPDTTSDSEVILPHIDQSSWHFATEHYTGAHDTICYVCGGPGLLFGCNGCESSYHSQCMSPALDPNDVSNVWFCPHCYASAMNFDSGGASSTMGTGDSTQNFGSNSTGGLQTPVSQTISPPFNESEEAQIYQMQLRQQNIPGSAGLSYDFHNFQSNDPVSDFSHFNDLSAHQSLGNISSGFSQSPTHPSQQPIPYDRQSTTSSAVTDATRDNARASSQFGSFSTTEAEPHTKNKSKSTKETTVSARHHSPPRKRSKYSALPAELDDALAVIHNHLENAYKNKKSDEGAADKIKILEQRLKMQENELIMARQEISRLKNALNNAQSADDISNQLKSENEQLKQEATKRDEELKEWQRMLKTMLGSSIMPTQAGGGQNAS